MKMDIHVLFKNLNVTFIEEENVILHVRDFKKGARKMSLSRRELSFFNTQIVIEFTTFK